MTEQLKQALRTAIARIEDMLLGDDGQAWKEAQKSLPRLKAVLEDATPEPVGEPVIWRWLNANGEAMTAWLPYKPDQRAYNEQQAGEVNGTVEYAYTRPAPGVAEGFTLDQIADACVLAEVSDSKFESISIALAAAQAKGENK